MGHLLISYWTTMNGVQETKLHRDHHCVSAADAVSYMYIQGRESMDSAALSMEVW